MKNQKNDRNKRNLEQGFSLDELKKVSDLENEYEQDKRNLEIALDYAIKLKSLSDMKKEEWEDNSLKLKDTYDEQGSSLDELKKELEDTSRKLEDISGEHVSDHQIAGYYAESLVNLIIAQEEYGERKKIIEKMEGLYSQYGSKSDIAFPYADGLMILSEAQKDEKEKEETIEKLVDVYHKFYYLIDRWDEKQWRQYVKGIESLYDIQKEKENKKKIIEKLQAFYGSFDVECEKEERIARIYVKMLWKLSEVQEEKKELEETVNKLQEIYEKNKQNERIASIYAKMLWKLSKVQEEKKELEETVNKLQEVYEKNKQNESIAISYALSVFYLNYKYSNKYKWRETAEKLKSIYKESGEVDIIAAGYAKSLGYSRMNLKEDEKEKKTGELKNLMKKHKEPEIAATYFEFVVDGVLSVNDEFDNSKSDAKKEADDIKKVKSAYEDIRKIIPENSWCEHSDADFIFRSLKKLAEKNKQSSLDEITKDFILPLTKKAEPAFKRILKMYSECRNDKKELCNLLIEMFFVIMEIREKLVVKENNEKKYAHYTKIERIYDLMGNKSDNRGAEEGENKKTSKVRLFNACYMNDPSEGKALLEYLGRMKNVEDLENHDEESGKKSIDSKEGLLKELSRRYREEFGASKVYLFSMTEAVDMLPMWSMYGENGQGCCLILDSKYVDSPDESSPSSITTLSTPKHDGDSSLGFDSKKEKFRLYRVFYLPDEKSDDKGSESESLSDLKVSLDCLKKLIDDIEQCMNSETWEAQEKEIYLDLITDSLDEIRYLFKMKDYSFEQEYRMLKSVDIEDPRIKMQEIPGSVPRLYIENPKVRYKEIVLGPKVSDPDYIAPYITYRDKNIKVKKSKIEYR